MDRGLHSERGDIVVVVDRGRVGAAVGLFDWYLTSGDVEFHTGGSDPMTFKVSGPSAEHLRGLSSDGIESAVIQAKTAAAGKSVGVHGANTIQQCLNAGLFDEIHVDIAAVLLGSGVRPSTASPARQSSLATRR